MRLSGALYGIRRTRLVAAYPWIFDLTGNPIPLWMTRNSWHTNTQAGVRAMYKPASRFRGVADSIEMKQRRTAVFETEFESLVLNAPVPDNKEQ
jgi:hypothetical protein